MPDLAPSKPSGFFATWARITFKPRAFFSPLSTEPSSWGPIKFALVVSALSLPVNMFFLISSESGVGSAALFAALAILVISPLMTPISIYTIAGLIHLSLALVRGRNAPFKETLRCYSYSQAPQLFAMFPIVGTLIGAVWGLVVLCIGLKRVQATTTPRAVFAAFAGPVLALAIALVPALAFRFFVFEPFRIPAGGMAPTIQAGDQIFANKFIYRSHAPKRGDVVIFRSPQNRSVDLIKRVVAVGGDMVEIRDRALHLNGSRVATEYVGIVQGEDVADEIGKRGDESSNSDKYQETLDGNRYSVYFNQGHEPRGCYFGCSEPTPVPSGTVFVMGDNRDDSYDSRFWGVVPNDLIKGRANLIWWSSSTDGRIRWSRIGTSIYEGNPR